MTGGWIAVRERLPEPGKQVLVRLCGGSMEVMFILECEATIAGTGQKVIRPWWYPGGAPIANSTHWMELPAGPEAGDAE